MNKKSQKGTTMVEFALIALMFFMLIFGAIEFARAWFVYNTLTEATRAGARIAAVCPADTLRGRVRVVNAMFFNSNLRDLGSLVSGGFLGLEQQHIIIEYLSANGSVIGSSPSGDGDADWYNQVAFVRVRIDDQAPNGFRHRLLIPFFDNWFYTPGFSTTLPRESLGRIDAINPVTQRNC